MNLFFEKQQISKLNGCLLSVGLLLAGGVVSGKMLLATTGGTCKTILEKQEVEVDVYKDSKGNYVIKTDEFNDESLGGEFKCLSDVDGNGVISVDKSLIEKNDGDAIGAVKVSQETKHKLTQIQAIHHYKNYKGKMEYTVTQTPQSLMDNDDDGDRDFEDLMPHKYQNNAFNNTIYALDKMVITHHDNIVQIDYFYSYE